MLAVASLAAGFVVAAVTPSHALDSDAHKDLKANDTLSTLDHTVSSDSLAMDDNALLQKG